MSAEFAGRTSVTGFLYRGRVGREGEMNVQVIPEEVNVVALAGDDITLRGKIVDEDGNPVSIAAAIGVRFVLAATEGGAALVTRTATIAGSAEGIIDDAAGGLYKIYIPIASTSGLDIFNDKKTIYHGSAMLKDSAGKYITITEGEWRFEKARQTTGW